VQIENQANGGLIRVPLIHGGFDPVPVLASEGDQLKLTVLVPSGATVTRTIRVPARRPPTIVRSDPRKGRTDIALNVSITVVFTEPVDASAVAQSMYLLHEGKRVSGIVRLGDNSWTAKFFPDAPLEAQSSYELVVTPGVRDLDGDVLEGSYNATFLTGSIADSPCPGYADPSDCPPFPTGGSGVVSGVLFERTPDGLRPFSGAMVFAWVQQGGNGYARGATQTGAGGTFSINTLPSATIMLQGYAPGYDQPCSTTLQFNGISGTANIELVSQARPLPDAATKPPLVKGVVYETTATGRQPVAGARVFVDLLLGLGLVGAITTTDENGRYAACQLPDFGPGQTIQVVKTGYEMAEQSFLVSGTTELQLDIELKH
jgi:hypothetical protein